MKLFAIEIKTAAMIAAEDAEQALEIAERDARQIFGEDGSPTIELDSEIKSIGSLPNGWDGECLPYGGDGNTRLKDLLPNT